MTQVVWVVLEEDRGAGAYVVGVFSTWQAAEAACVGGHQYIQKCEVE